MIKGEDTIAAVSTALGEAGIGIVRLSGPAAIAVADRAFRPKRGLPLSRRKSHTVTYGWVMERRGNPLDECIAVLMRGPRSFTGEDVVEFQCHGGQVAVRRVLEAVLEMGARVAEPGEFTRRAFLNGRMDLSQAEAVIDVIRAKTDRAMDAAVNQLRGGLGDAVRAVRERLLELAAHLEADIDFPELDLEVSTHDEVETGCRWCLDRVQELLAGSRQGKLLREGFRVVLAGRPNVGKSSLLNRLVRENRAIVTAIPGTTRDVIEEWISIGGLPVVLADTAGIRETEDEVERLGVDRSRAMLEKAELVLVVLEAIAGVTEEDRRLMSLVPRKAARLAVFNKVDLARGIDPTVWQGALEGLDVVLVSAETGEGIAQLEGAIARAAGLADKEESFLANARQEEALRRAARHLEGALETRRAGFGSDLLSIDVRACWAALGEITGETVDEDLIDQIFSRFCIGK